MPIQVTPNANQDAFHKYQIQVELLNCTYFVSVDVESGFDLSRSGCNVMFTNFSPAYAEYV